MSVVFLNGWGVSASEAAESLRASGIVDSPRVVSLRAGCIEEVCKGSEDTLIAYSTGAMLVLREERARERFKQAILLAPFFDFRAESQLGGKTRKAQLKYLLRWLGKDPLAAVNDFRERAGLAGKPLQELPASKEDLVWGIEQLLNDAAAPCLPEGFRGYVGDADPLLDAQRLRSLSASIEIAPQAGHALGELLAAMRIEP